MGYQTFPWAKGDSASYKKLVALQIPSLKGKTFLDVGCNEGYFCGYAEFLGAKSVTGIDNNSRYLSVARCLFPQCTFLCQDWDDLGEETYDVILNASAIHYAKDQKAFIDLLMSRLKPRGTLILEIGVAPGDSNEFVEVTRAIDKRLFPTKAKLFEMLDGYAIKFISRSAPQPGDPIPREVYHISHKLPYAILALDNPHAGKTFTIKEILNPDIKRIPGDRLYFEVADGRREGPAFLRELLEQNKPERDCGFITYLICKNNFFEEFCRWLAHIGGQENFILDMYIPASFRQPMARYLEKAGYYVVNLQLQKAVSRPRAEERAPRDACLRYVRHLREEFMINEEDYLAANPDVAEALKAGKITGALAHYIFHGRKEGRKRTPEKKGAPSDEA